MKVCFPIASEEAVDGPIYGHFASAPFFVILDTDTLHGRVIPNCDPNRPFAGCDPFHALTSQALDGIVVDGVGDESVRAMGICGFRLLQACSVSIPENLALFASGGLDEVEVLGSAAEGRCSSGGEEHVCHHGSH